MISGEDGNDDLYGGPQDDTLAGSYGNDEIWDGTGRDTVDAGGGTDTWYHCHDGSNDIVLSVFDNHVHNGTQYC